MTTPMVYRLIVFGAALVVCLSGCDEAAVDREPTDPGTSAPGASTPDPGASAPMPLDGPPLAIPAGVRAAPAPEAVTLHWDAVAGAEAYRVYWSERAIVSADDRWLAVDGASPRVTHRPLRAGQTYTYRIAARRGERDGPLSAPVRVQLPPARATKVLADGAP